MRLLLSYSGGAFAHRGMAAQFVFKDYFNFFEYLFDKVFAIPKSCGKILWLRQNVVVFIPEGLGFFYGFRKKR